MNRFRFANSLSMTAASGLLLTLCSCVLPHKVQVTDTGAPQYDKVEISYQIRGSHSELARDTFHSRGQVAAVGNSTADNTGNWSRAALKIEYPHPEGEPDLARATLRLSRSWSLPESPSLFKKVRTGFGRFSFGDSPEENVSTSDDELWVLDFPRQQLDLMLIDLAGSGFFDDQKRPEGGANLSVMIDRGQTAKPWSMEPRLDDVVLRVQREGWLVGFTTPNNQRKLSDSTIAQKQ